MLVIVQGELRVGKMGNKRTAFNGKVPSRKRVKSAVSGHVLLVKHRNMEGTTGKEKIYIFMG